MIHIVVVVRFKWELLMLGTFSVRVQHMFSSLTARPNRSERERGGQPFFVCARSKRKVKQLTVSVGSSFYFSPPFEWKESASESLWPSTYSVLVQFSYVSHLSHDMYVQTQRHGAVTQLSVHRQWKCMHEWPLPFAFKCFGYNWRFYVRIIFHYFCSHSSVKPFSIDYEQLVRRVHQ